MIRANQSNLKANPDMEISLTDAGKRYNREWIFRHLSVEFTPKHRYAITGPNGSGKSTLLQTLSGYIQLNEGSIGHRLNGTAIVQDAIYRQFSIAAPYLSLVEEMTAVELIHFHQQLKPLSLPANELLTLARLDNEKKKPIRYFSSGMKQRLKLALAFFSLTDLLLLDEPLTNLDAAGAELYHDWSKSYLNDRLVVIASNNPEEYRSCDRILAIGPEKKIELRSA